jgi:type IV pilus assembly protein PilA
MFQRFHAMSEKREGGFTLIELLVVILIIAILAAIAIPVFLKQREKAWADQVQSTLKNAATAQESHLTEPASTTYATTIAQLQTQGFNAPAAADVLFTNADINVSGASSYCMEAVSAHKADIDYTYSSTSGRPTEGLTCP